MRPRRVAALEEFVECDPGEKKVEGIRVGDVKTGESSVFVTLGHVPKRKKTNKKRSAGCRGAFPYNRMFSA